MDFGYKIKLYILNEKRNVQRGFVGLRATSKVCDYRYAEITYNRSLVSSGSEIEILIW